jgi:hypothetical protein
MGRRKCQKLHNLQFSTNTVRYDQNKDDSLFWTCSIVKMDVKETVTEDVDWIHKTRSKDHWKILANTVIN